MACVCAFKNIWMECNGSRGFIKVFIFDAHGVRNWKKQDRLKNKQTEYKNALSVKVLAFVHILN